MSDDSQRPFVLRANL